MLAPAYPGQSGQQAGPEHTPPESAIIASWRYRMAHNLSRRQFARAGAAASLTALLPQGLFGNTSQAKKAVIHAAVEIGLVRPEFHSNFAEHLGSCTYGG